MAAIPRLAAAVSNAASLGMVTLTWSEDAGAVVRETAALTARPFGGNLVLTEDHHRRLDQAAWLGTRFLLAEEMPIHEDSRPRRIAAAETDPQRYGNLYSAGWPDAPHRALRNSTADVWQA